MIDELTVLIDRHCYQMINVEFKVFCHVEHPGHLGQLWAQAANGEGKNVTMVKG
jgi:hypothetical protein